MQDKVSIIVPVYNTEKYLPKCIESVISQTYKNWELILVNDCSTDNSPKIIDEYIQKDKRIKSLKTPESLRPGGARNLGLKSAAGDYIMFLDSDDWILSETIEECIEKFSDSEIDCVVFGYRAIHTDKSEKDSDHFQYDRDEKIKLGTGTIHQIYTAPWGKIYKTKHIKDIYFPEKILFAEDVEFCMKYFWLKLPTIYYIKKAFYQYQRYSNSAIASNSKNGYYFLISVLNVLDSLLATGYFGELRQDFINFLKPHFNLSLPVLDSSAQKKWCELAKQIFDKISITEEEKTVLGIRYDMSTTYDNTTKNRMYENYLLQEKLSFRILINLYKKHRASFSCLEFFTKAATYIPRKIRMIVK